MQRRKRQLTSALVTAIIFSAQIICQPAFASSVYTIQYKSTYVDWTFQITNVGPTGLTTDTPYKLMVTGKAHEVPNSLLLNDYINSTGCKLLPIWELPLQDQIVQMRNPALWNHRLYGSFAGPQGLVQVQDPINQLRAQDYFFQDVWTDTNNKHYLSGSEDSDNAEFLKFSKDNAVTRKVPLRLEFTDAGDYNLSFENFTWASVYPENFRAPGCYGFQFPLEVVKTQDQIFFGKVKEKELATQSNAENSLNADKLKRSCISLNNELKQLNFKIANLISKTKKTPKLLLGVLNNAPKPLKCSLGGKPNFDLELKGQRQIFVLYKKSVESAMARLAKSN